MKQPDLYCVIQVVNMRVYTRLPIATTPHIYTPRSIDCVTQKIVLSAYNKPLNIYRVPLAYSPWPPQPRLMAS